MISGYTGEGPHTTPWQDIVKDCGEAARGALAALTAQPAASTIKPRE